MDVIQAIEGYFIYAEAAGLSPHTLRDYSTTFRRFVDFVGEDKPVGDVTPREVQLFLRSLNGLSAKTKLNYHTGLSALWTWLVQEDIVDSHVIRKVRPPKPEKKQIVPFSHQDIGALLNALKRSKPYKRSWHFNDCNHAIPNPERNKAIIFILLDTGLRATELCELRMKHVDLSARQFIVMGKGRKQRIVPISAKTTQVLWRYLSTRGQLGPEDYLIRSQRFPSLTRHGLRGLLNRIGDRAGVRNCYPHRFRHTFAIEYLRNGGDTETLQRILGHADLKMIRTYLQLASQDLQARHRSASPVANAAFM